MQPLMFDNVLHQILERLDGDGDTLSSPQEVALRHLRSVSRGNLFLCEQATVIIRCFEPLNDVTSRRSSKNQATKPSKPRTDTPATNKADTKTHDDGFDYQLEAFICLYPRSVQKKTIANVIASAE